MFGDRRACGELTYGQSVFSSCFVFKEKHTIRYCDAIINSWFLRGYKTPADVPELPKNLTSSDGDYIIGDIAEQLFFTFE